MENNFRPNPKKSISFPFLDDGQLGGGNVQSINIGGQAGEGLLGAVGTIERIELANIHRTSSGAAITTALCGAMLRAAQRAEHTGPEC